ncbi:MAG: ATP-dependent DNA helicase RecG [Lachnospiraceae bacterium]|nr:ATP-dependent DNA helicase RecG [Lachnospiraceae bacterium]
MVRLSDPLTELKGIGDKTAQAFTAAGILSVNDLLHHFPASYERLPELRPMAEISREGKVCVCGRASGFAALFHKNGRSLLQFPFEDGSARAKVTVFGMPYLKKQIVPGRELLLFAYAKRKGEQLFLTQPRFLSREEYENGIRSLTPRYPLSGALTQNQLRRAVSQALGAAEQIGEYLPEQILKERKLPSISAAIRGMHAPADMEEVYAARRRLAFDEFFLFLARMELLKEGTEKEESAYRISRGRAAAEAFVSGLPYSLTAAQQRSIDEILGDMESGYMMNRLLQGDVGSGKTAVAFAAAAAVIAEGHQAVLMAPTEVLAAQHYRDARKLAEERPELSFRPVLLSSSLKAAEKREAKKRMESGGANLLIGTHALIQEGVAMKDAALVITDEQHRFGVRQRMSLSEKGKGPHVLVMSATPIPRTLGLILYGDLDISLIDELPARRLPIKNALVDESWREKMYQFMYKRILEGRQVYVICPQVEEGEDAEIRSVSEYGAELRERFPEQVRIATLHGRMKAAEKNAIMESFAAGETDILVSTTVVEVGVNVPNATVMVVENAERFGLSQLHQLRGRVGRGEHQSYCVFVAGGTDGLSRRTQERLNILKETNDGFRIAEEDLKQRGPGDFFGLRQSGTPMFCIADIFTDAQLLTETKLSIQTLSRDKDQNFRKLREILKERDLTYSEFHGICL